MQTLEKQIPYKVKDINLGEWGRKEIRLAEAEMPGLMALMRIRLGASSFDSTRTAASSAALDAAYMV